MNIKLLMVAGLLLLASSGVQAVPTVGFNESTVKAGLGETITLDIVMADFPTTEGGGLTLEFNPKVIQVNGVELNDGLWSFATRSGAVDNDKGKVTDLLFSSFAGVSGTAVIATVTLEIVGKGRSQLTLIESQLNPFASDGRPLDVTLKKSVVRVGSKDRSARAR
jgi:hypothetical protein